MKPRDIALVVLMAAIWGFNFIPMRVGLNHLPPLTFTVLRFLMTTFPALFFVRHPKIPVWRMAVYGGICFAGQFGFSFSGIHAGMSPGLAALVMQVQTFFTIGIAAVVWKEKPTKIQILGAMAAMGGVALVGSHVGGDMTLAGFVLIIIAAMCWSVGSLIGKSFGSIDMLSVIVWGNFYALLCMLPFAVYREGAEAMLNTVTHMEWVSLLCLGYGSYVSMFVGYTIWNVMMARYPAAAVAPFTLLIPVFAMVSASLALGEPYPLWKFEATVLILSGLALNQFGGFLASRFNRSAPAAD